MKMIQKYCGFKARSKARMLTKAPEVWTENFSATSFFTSTKVKVSKLICVQFKTKAYASGFYRLSTVIPTRGARAEFIIQ